MLFLDDPLLLARRRATMGLESYLAEHIKHVATLQYHSDVADHCQALRTELAKHARERSPVYGNHVGVIDKSLLEDKGPWYVPGYRTQLATTGGSTTSRKFQYLRWTDHFYTIERDLHYRAILNEYGVAQTPKILYLLLDLYNDRSTDQMVKVTRTDNILVSHGAGRAAEVHQVITNRPFYNNHYGFYEELLEYCRREKFDLVLSHGPTIASLAWHVRRLKWPHPIGKLLSNTGNKVNRADLDFLRGRGLIRDWCDHMRCWDGGITFMTCPHQTYHLLDALAWTWENDGRLISDDFYSLPSPFVNYWNGDHGEVGTTYSKCRCGRYFRDFKITRTRSALLGGVHNHTLRAKLLDSGVDCTGIIRAEIFGNFLRVFTKYPYPAEARATVRKAIEGFEVNFVTEEPNG